MYKINIDHPCSVNGVEVINVNPELKKKVDYQLQPMIKETDGKATHYVYAIKGDENKYELVNNTLFVTYNDDIYLMMMLRKSVRDILFDPFLQSGYTKMHSSSVKKDEDVYIILGNERAGKTSTALGLCKFEGYSFIGGDLSLVKDNDLIGWQTCISARNKTFDILGLKAEHQIYSDDKEYIWLWPKDYEQLGYSLSTGGKIKRCVFHKYDFGGKNEERLLTPEQFREKLIQNIHYEEINKANYWNTEPVSIEQCRRNIENSSLLNDPSNAVDVISTGLSEENIKRLVKVMR